MLKDTLGLDARDVRLLSTLMKNPTRSQTELAKDLKISQPSVNARIQKLKNKGVLANSSGIEFNKTRMHLTRVDFTAPNAKTILENLSKCSFFVNGFIMSGKNNASMFIVSHNLEKVESIINTNLRKNSDVKDINSSIIVNTTKDFVCSIDLEREQAEACRDKGSCDHCTMHNH